MVCCLLYGFNVPIKGLTGVLLCVPLDQWQLDRLLMAGTGCVRWPKASSEAQT